jgi:hypothetical protein
MTNLPVINRSFFVLFTIVKLPLSTRQAALRIKQLRQQHIDSLTLVLSSHFVDDFHRQGILNINRLKEQINGNSC